MDREESRNLEGCICLHMLGRGTLQPSLLVPHVAEIQMSSHSGAKGSKAWSTQSPGRCFPWRTPSSQAPAPFCRGPMPLTHSSYYLSVRGRKMGDEHIPRNRGPLELQWFLSVMKPGMTFKKCPVRRLFQLRVDKVAGSSRGGPQKSGHSGRASTTASRAVSSTPTSSPVRLKCSR